MSDEKHTGLVLAEGGTIEIHRADVCPDEGVELPEVG